MLDLKFSILVPTRSRPDNVIRLLESLKKTSNNVNSFEVLFYCDDDDTKMLEKKEEILKKYNDLNIKLFFEPIGTVKYNNWWDFLCKRSSGKYIMQGGDDLVFKTKNWDKIIEETIELECKKNNDRILLVGAWDGAPDHKNAELITHSIVTREWVDALGYFTTGYFSSNFNDTWLTELAKKINRLVFIPDVLIDHLHPFYGKGQDDEIYRKQQSLGAEGFAEWGKYQEKLNLDANKLKSYLSK